MFAYHNGIKSFVKSKAYFSNTILLCLVSIFSVAAVNSVISQRYETVEFPPRSSVNVP